MVRFQPLKLASISLIGLVALAASPASAAGSCGGFYPVDAPTTLKAVATACRVSLVSLREANPGVNPGNVRPGEHLAVPMSISHHLTMTAPVSDTDAFSKLRVNLPFTEDLGFRARTAQRIHLLAASLEPNALSWLEPDAATSGHLSSSAPISFQKIAALRIETAGFQSAGAPILVSGIPAARFTDNAATSGGYRLPDYNAIGAAPPVLIMPAPAVSSLTGVIDNSYDGCFTLRTADGKFWRLAAAPITDAMIGQTVSIWGSPSTGNACGAGASVRVDHMVYAEPWVVD